MKVFLIIALFLSGALARSEGTTNILGVWVPQSKDSRVEIFKEGEKYYGKVIWIKEEDRNKLDNNNPDKSLRARPLLGLVFLHDFIEKKAGLEWQFGKVYDPHNGKTYTARIYYKPETDTLELRGFVGIPLFGRTDKWTRYKEQSGD